MTQNNNGCGCGGNSNVQSLQQTELDEKKKELLARIRKNNSQNKNLIYKTKTKLFL
jgi:hypothetical protein